MRQSARNQDHIDTPPHRHSVSLVSLGCAKNAVDSEVLLGLLQEQFRLVADPDRADAVIINTCCFIEAAMLEATEYIRHFEMHRREGRLKALVVAGCLPQRLKKQELRSKFPAVDAFIGPGDVPRAPAVLARCLNGERVIQISAKSSWLYDHGSPRVQVTPPHTAYVKIAEGCSHQCSFCLIPRLRGRFRSRRMGSVVREIKRLSEDGNLQEVNLVAQDTTAYGIDLYGRPRLDSLLERLARQPLVPWIRLLYAYPRDFTQSVIDCIATHKPICNYVDLPLQHCNDQILKRMRRGVTKRGVLSVLEKLRASIPDLTLRTTLMVGFPGETDRQFEELLDFVAEQRFDRLGAFAFSPEEGVPATREPTQVPKKVKEERLDALMLLQQGISEEMNRERIGSILDVLVEGVDPDDPSVLVGRSEADAPEVDGTVRIPGGAAKSGEFVKVRITGATEYDLVGAEIRVES